MGSEPLTLPLLVKAAGGATPLPSPSPWPFSSSSEEDDKATELPEESSNSSQNQPLTKGVEKHCLPRDGYRCVLSNIWSGKCPDELRPAHVSILETAPTQICHIIPLALAQAEHSSCVDWSPICHMFPGLRTHIADHLENIDGPANIFTTMTEVHLAFGKFDLAFDRQVRTKLFLK